MDLYGILSILAVIFGVVFYLIFKKDQKKEYEKMGINLEEAVIRMGSYKSGLGIGKPFDFCRAVIEERDILKFYKLEAPGLLGDYMGKICIGDIREISIKQKGSYHILTIVWTDVGIIVDTVFEFPNLKDASKAREKILDGKRRLLPGD